jgi:hypothetical protein
MRSRQRARRPRYEALFRDDFLRQFLALPAVRMVDEAAGKAGVTAARAGFQVEPQERMVPTLFAERSKLQARQVGEIRGRELAFKSGANGGLRT